MNNQSIYTKLSKAAVINQLRLKFHHSELTSNYGEVTILKGYKKNLL